MSSAPVVFRSSRERFHADACAPLIQAARSGRIRLDALGRGGYPGAKLPAASLPEVRSLGVWSAARRQTWGLDWHRNEGIELTLLTSGSLDFSLRDRTYRLRPLDLTITRPWQEHRVGQPFVSASRLIWLILDLGVRRPNQAWRWPNWLLLDGNLRNELTRMLRWNEHPVWRADKAVEAAFEKIASACGVPFSREQALQLKILFNELWLSLVLLLRRRRPDLDSYLPSAERTVQMFLAELPRRAEEPWTLARMSSACGIGRTSFARYCRKLTNLSPVQYLTRCRMERAGELLEASDQTVLDIAISSGFSSSQYFATVFRREYGVSPLRWRGVRGAVRESRIS